MIFRLREIREARGIQMKEMAKKLGVAVSTLSQIENGNIKPSIDRLEPIANILDVNIGELFGEMVSDNVRILKIKYYQNLMNIIFNDEKEFNFILNNNKNYEIFNIDKNSLATINVMNMFNNIIALKYNNNSMYPILQDKDLVFVDLNDKNILDNKMFLIKEGNILKIRRIKQPSPLYPNYEITADNNRDMDYKEYNLTFEQLSGLIYGRVVFYMRNVF
jgi:transcriptional regulator with XRE-family HTH domain